MKLSEMTEQCAFTVLQSEYDDCDITGVYTSDLLSDVMANAGESSVLVTVQAHKNTVAVAGLSGMSGIILCSGREAPADMIEAARKERIGIFVARDAQYAVSWKLHDLTGV